jgi:hypothetical protein
VIEDVVDTIRKNFRANGCPAEVEVGPQFVAENAAPPRVVFVPGAEGDSFEGPLTIQQRFGATVEQPYQNPRSVATRWAGAVVHIWGAGVKQTEPQLQNAADRAALGALLNQTISAIHEAGFGSYRLLGGAVDTKTKLIGYGLLYLLRIQLAIPVLQIPWVNDAPFGPGAAARTGNTWTNLSDVKPKIEESFDPSGNPVTVILP